MGFRKAADFFSVSKWKLYKTARKRGIYAEIKKQNQAQQALAKVPTNVQHFADLGVYKQLKKKTHLAREALFPHLPGQPGVVVAPAMLSSNNNNNGNSNNNNPVTTRPNSEYPSMLDLQKKLLASAPLPLPPTLTNTNGSTNKTLAALGLAAARSVVHTEEGKTTPLIMDEEDEEMEAEMMQEEDDDEEVLDVVSGENDVADKDDSNKMIIGKEVDVGAVADDEAEEDEDEERALVISSNDDDEEDAGKKEQEDEKKVDDGAVNGGEGVVTTSNDDDSA